MKREEIFIETEDDWESSFEVDGVEYVKLILSQTGPNPPNDGEYRISVWGMENFGMYRDFLIYDDALSMYNDLKSRSEISKEDLDAYGFDMF